MAQAQKFKRVVAVIEQRIRRGDYLLRPVPSERKIAEETGVSHMTARKAVRTLLDRDVLVRGENGILAVSPGFQADAGPAPLLMLYPAFASTYLVQLWQTVSRAAEAYGLGVRPVQYVHWDDPIVINAVGNRGGVIVIPSSHDVPAHLLPKLRAGRVVSLDVDLSDQGLPSIGLFTDAHICQVFDHLHTLGHTHIDCISTHTHNPEIDRRIKLWRDWGYRNGVTGDLHELAAPSFSDPTPQACKKMKSLLAGRSSRATAFVGTTFPAAVGAMRACWEHGLVVGRDVSVCAMNIESPARFMTPSVTGLDVPDLSAVLSRCFDWFVDGAPWDGPLCLHPRKADFFVGESTGKPAPAS